MHDANHPVRRLVEFNGLAKQPRVTAKHFRPRAITQNDHMVRVRLVVLRPKQAAEARLRAEYVKPLTGNLRSLQALGQIVASVLEIHVANQRGMLKQLAPVAYVGKVRSRDTNVLQVQLVVMNTNRNDTLRVGDPSRMQ